MLVIPLIGCAASNTQLQGNKLPTSKISLEKIYGLDIQGKTLKLKVMSNGCTKVKSFNLIWQSDSLTVHRLKPDYCRRMPHEIWLQFNIPKKISEFTIKNRFS